jgi:hypothetical protein
MILTGSNFDAEVSNGSKVSISSWQKGFVSLGHLLLTCMLDHNQLVLEDPTHNMISYL